jgi:hypothetical protein
VDAENLVLCYAAEHGLPAVALCVANTYGPGDYAPTPRGALLAAAAAGKMPVYIEGTASEVVGVEDAATALLLAAEKGRNGERYIISERFIGARTVRDGGRRGWFGTAAIRNSAAPRVCDGLRRERARTADNPRRVARTHARSRMGGAIAAHR